MGAKELAVGSPGVNKQCGAFWDSLLCDVHSMCDLCPSLQLPGVSVTGQGWWCNVEERLGTAGSLVCGAQISAVRRVLRPFG